METKSNNLTATPEKTEPVELSKDEFQQLLTFFATGLSENKEFSALKGQKLIPVHYKYWEENDIIPNPFPLCFIEDYPDKIAISLDEFFIQLKNESADEDKEHSEKVFNDLKKHIKSHLNGFSEEYLNKIWDQSTQTLLKAYQESDENDQKKILEKVLSTAKKKLNIGGELVALSEQTPLKYLNLAIDKVWQKKSTDFTEELDWLILRLNGFLQADYLKTKEGKAPENLRESVGDTFEDDLDFKALSHILKNAIEEDTLTPVRQKRIRSVAKSLENFRKYYPGFVNHQKTIPLKFKPENNDLKKIKEQLKNYKAQVLEFYKSIHIARLEVTNQYSEQKHDTFFKDFHFSFLSPEDVSSIPPFPVFLSSRDIENSSFEELTELMEVNLPVKLLFVVDDVINFKNSDQHIVQTNKWSRKLASMAINVSNAFILKSTVLNLSQSEKEILNGLQYDGPALFCIFRHNKENFKNQDDATPYHALVNSRAFPLWTFTPTGKHEIAPQFNVTANPSPKEHWSDEIILDTPFTIIDFLASYKRLAQHFLVLPEEKYHANLIPFHEYQQLDDLIAKDKLPYTFMVNNNGNLFKVLPDYAIIKATDNFIGNWRTLQELSNVHNLKEANTAEDIKEQPAAQQEIPKSKDEISREIVSNILSRLISGDLEPRPMEETTTTVEVENEPQAAEKEEVEEEQPVQEEAVPEPKRDTEEPYIETALCTSCNECTNINSMMFAYNEDKQAYIKDVTKGTFKQLVMAAEKCPAAIIHPGKPKNPNEKDLDKLVKRAEKFN